ncbi:OmpH family outer membrane protein [Sphingomonas hylomeconis]|uniref:OmpH family outer membrane protein n=1 Tax=Sphingomonas hylomeconis TaxID=1395958 RepID=A0ABV7SWX5_9SPHN|nr:OmpH family outer membrane protein [Sphingomonas hylomeconis]
MNNVALLTALVPLALSAPAVAQTAPVAPIAEGLGGPVIPGICLVSRQAIFSNAKIGLAADARIRQITSEAQREVDAERAPIDADVKAFQAEAAKLTPEQRVTRERALNARLQPVQAKAQRRSQEIEATRAKALQRVASEAQPVLAQVYAARKCGLLLDRTSVLGGNLANDLTADVVRGLDAKITTITFNRETIAAPAAQPKR